MARLGDNDKHTVRLYEYAKILLFMSFIKVRGLPPQEIREELDSATHCYMYFSGLISNLGFFLVKQYSFKSSNL